MLRRIFAKKRPEGDLAAEIAAHLAIEADERRNEGSPADEAAAAAHRAFGNVTAIQEAYREHERWTAAAHFARDVRHALRLARRSFGFSAIVVLTLAFGIGANSAIFSVIRASLLKALPYRDPNALAMLWSEDPAHGITEGHVSLDNFADWQTRSHAFAGMTFFIGQTFLLGNHGGPPERLRSARVPANFFPLLGVEPLIGRVFSQSEQDRAERLVVLSYGLWQRRYARSPAALGANIVMDGRTSRIIGVMPPSFQYPFGDTQLWEPVTAHPYWAARDRHSPRSQSIWYALARLRTGATWNQAQTEMSAIARQLAAEHPESRNLPEVRVVPLPRQTAGSVERPLEVLFASVFLMLLIACINVANLLLARGSARQREFAVRRALGAGRAALARQLLTESFVLAVAGGAAGLGLAALALRAIVAFGPREIPRLDEARIDPPVLLFTLLLSLFSAALAGLWPALRGGAAQPGSRQWGTAAHRRMRNALVVAEFAIALVLLAGAGLMLRSFLLLANVAPGFRPDKLLVMRIDLHVGKTAAQQVAYFRDAIARAQALPGVSSAGAISGFLRSDPEDSVTVEGRAPKQPGPCLDSIAGDYFQTAGIPLLAGRYYSNDDRLGSMPVAIVNQSAARAYWPGQTALGKRFRFTAGPWLTVVGITGDMHRQGLEKQIVPQAFLPHAQATDDMLDLIVRTAADPAAVMPAVRGEIQAIDAGVAKFGVVTVQQQLAEQSAGRRFQTSLIGLFSLAALILSALGIYGLMHYLVVQRTSEIGVRMALGAGARDVAALILGQGLRLAGCGAALGVCAALALTHLIGSLLYGIAPTDPLTFALAPVVLLIAAAAACWMPALRASRIDPIRALRQE